MIDWIPRALACLGLLLGLLTHRTVGSPFAVTLDRERYVVQGGEVFPVSVLISPLPAPGVFSYGVRLRFPALNAQVVGVESIQTVVALGFDGPRAAAPVLAVGPGMAAVKGTAEFFEARRPVSTNALLATFLVRDLAPGPYPLELELFNTLGPTEQIFVDGQGAVLDGTLTLGRATVVRDGSLQAEVLGPLVLNRQSGLFEQSVRVTNGRFFTAPAVRLHVTQVPAGWQVWNRHGLQEGRPYLDHRHPVAAGESVTFRVEYRVPDRNPQVQPAYLAELINAGDEVPTPPGTPFAVVPRARLPDGAFLLEFDSLANRSYSIQYSPDLTRWTTVVPAVAGNGSRLQWIDPGPPKTDRPPGEATNRYYRVFLLP